MYMAGSPKGSILGGKQGGEATLHAQKPMEARQVLSKAPTMNSVPSAQCKGAALQHQLICTMWENELSVARCLDFLGVARRYNFHVHFSYLKIYTTDPKA